MLSIFCGRVCFSYCQPIKRLHTCSWSSFPSQVGVFMAGLSFFFLSSLWGNSNKCILSHARIRIPTELQLGTWVCFCIRMYYRALRRSIEALGEAVRKDLLGTVELLWNKPWKNFNESKNFQRLSWIVRSQQWWHCGAPICSHIYSFCVWEREREIVAMA